MEAGVTRRQRRGPLLSRLVPPFLIASVCLLAPGLLHSQEAGALPLRPGETLPPPRQRGLNEILDMPTHEIVCPACEYVLVLPDVDKLMRRSPGDGPAPAWRMDETSRDSDLCPHPAPDKLSYQADLVVCPSCGLSAPGKIYAETLEPMARKWVIDTFRNDILNVEKTLLGKRADDMPETEMIDFFNRQQEIPDTVRTEHNRIRVLAKKEPALVRAEATWLAAWAARREVCRTPKGDFLAKRTASVVAAMASVKRQRTGVHGDMEALVHLLGRNRSGKERLGIGDRLAARIMLAGLKARVGCNQEAKRELEDLLRYFRDRFVHPEQDPLWSVTSSKQSRDRRRQEMEEIRSECEAETAVRIGLLQRQEEYLHSAAGLIREAILDGDLDSRPGEVLFYVYLGGDFLRRSGHLPLAAEWFKLILSLAPEGEPVEQAAQLQLAETRRQAGDATNLLSAIGEDAEAFERVREIRRHAQSY